MKYKELLDRVEKLEKFKEDYEIKQLQSKLEENYKFISKKYGLDIEIEVKQYFSPFYYSSKNGKYYYSAYINQESVYTSGEFISIKEVYESINYNKLEEVIKIYIYDNQLNKKNKVGRPKKENK